MIKENLRILVVDDTVFYRKIVSDTLAEFPNVEVVGTAPNGKIAMLKIANLKPDVLTLDIEMPEMDGLEVLSRIRKEYPNVAAIMLSSFTNEGGKMTLKALDLGAFDFILKPQDYSMEENKKILKSTIAPILRTLARRKETRSILKGKPRFSDIKTERKNSLDFTDVIQRMNTASGQIREKSKAVAVGISTGGPVALREMMPKISGDLGVPIFIVQHMPPLFTQALAEKLDLKCAIKIKEADDGEPVQPNKAYIAPGGKQMKITAGTDKKSKIVRVTDDPPENGCKPSADYLFRSVAQHFGECATGVIMTGMGYDGSQGLKLMKQKGAAIIAQDESTSVVFGMARKPIEERIVDVIAPLGKIAEEIRRTVK